MVLVYAPPYQAVNPPVTADFRNEALALASAARWADLKAFAEAEQATATPHPTSLPFLAFAEFGLGSPQRALALLDPLLRANSDLPLVWWVAGLSHLQLEAFEPAIQDARKLGDLQPRMAFEMLQRPTLLKHLGCEGPLPRRVAPTAERLEQPSAPPYPADARRQRISGDVVVDLILDATGKPLAACGVWGPEPLMLTALRYVKTFTFKPILPGKGPVMLRMVMPFRLLEGRSYLAPPKELLAADALDKAYGPN